MDVLDDILGSLRLTGGVVIDAELTGDFCLLAQFTPDHFAPFFPQPETLISYHYVRSGHALVEVEGQPDSIENAIEILGVARGKFSSDRLTTFVGRFEQRTGVRAAISDRELEGDYTFRPDASVTG